MNLLASLSGRRHATLAGEIADISVGGAYIRLQGERPAINSIVRLSFTAPLAGRPRRECRGLVVRDDKHGIGVMFVRQKDPAWLNSKPAVEQAQPAAAHVSARTVSKQSHQEAAAI